MAKKSGTEPLGAPSGGRVDITAVAEAIMQTRLTSLPELELHRQHPEAPPVRRSSHIDAFETRVNLVIPSFEH